MTRKSDATEIAEAEFTRLLKSTRLGRTARFESTVGSTNDVARDWADSGCPDGTLVFADEQTNGKGRHGRSWRAQKGVNLTFSVVLRPDIEPRSFSLITLAAGLALALTLKRQFPVLDVAIKWPNDVLINDRKCAGILMESSIGADQKENFVILGMGLNVNQDSFPDILEKSATSVLLETGIHQNRIGLLVDILAELEIQFARITTDEAGFRTEYERHLAWKGSWVRLKNFDTQPMMSGRIVGISEDGSLRLQTPEGIQNVYAADVTFERD